MAKTKKEAPPVGTPSQQLLEKVSKLRSLSMVKTADEAMDMSVECVSTGFPQLDRILRPVNGGWPRGRHAEVYSRREQSGKSSLMIQAAAAFQQAGLTCALANIENASTVEFFNALGLSTDVNHPTLCAPLLIGDMVGQLSAEEYLQAVKDTSSIVDFIGVDSVAAMDTAANLAKSVDEAKGMGGISQPLGGSIRSNLHPQAFIMWLNQSRCKIGAFNPAGGPVYCQPGGMAVGFFSSLRLEMSNIEKLKEKDSGDPIGFVVQIFTAKNRLGPPYRNCKLKYLFGEGFSSLWDYMDMAIKLGVIEKSGSWYEFTLTGDRAQGFMALYRLIKADPNLTAQLKHAIDGEAESEARVAENVDQALQFEPTRLEE